MDPNTAGAVLVSVLANQRLVLGTLAELVLVTADTEPARLRAPMLHSALIDQATATGQQLEGIVQEYPEYADPEPSNDRPDVGPLDTCSSCGAGFDAREGVGCDCGSVLCRACAPAHADDCPASDLEAAGA